jgi:hypothetical protein
MGSHEKRVPLILGLLGVNHVMHICPNVDLLGWGLIALAVSALVKKG